MPFGGFGSGGSKKKSTQDDLSVKLAAILDSDAPDEDKKKAIEVATGNEGDGEALWQKGLNLLSKPANAVINGVAVLGGEAGDAVFGRDDYNGWDQFVNRLQNNKSFGDLLRDNSITKDLPGPVQTVGGLAGDIALDPLTYVGGGVTKIGKAKLADEAFSAGSAALKAGESADEVVKLGQKVLKGTAKSDDLAKLSDNLIEAGVRSKPIKPGLVADFGRLGEVSIPGTSKLTDLRAAAKETAAEALGKTELGKVASATGNAFRKADKAALRDLVRNSDDAARAIGARELQKARSIAGVAKGSFVADMSSKLATLQSEVRKAKVNGADVTAALDGGVGSAAWDALEAKAPGLIPRIAEHDAEMRAAFNAQIDMPELQIVNRTNHAPSLLSEERAADKAFTSGGSPFAAAGFDKRANIVVGEDFYGHTLLPASEQSRAQIADDFARMGDHDTADYISGLDVHPEGLSPRQQAEQIAEQNDLKPIFDADWMKASQAQVHGMGKALEGRLIEQQARARGVALDRLKQQADEADALMQSADPAERSLGHAQKLDAQAGQMAEMIGDSGFDKLGVDATTAALKREPQKIADTFVNGMRDFGRSSQTDEDLVAALMAGAKVQSASDVGAFLKYWDKATQAWKAWAVASPGFHMRNMFGGMWNNYLAGVDIRAYWKFNKAESVYHKAIAKGATHPEGVAAVEKAMGRDVASAYGAVHDSGVLGTFGQIGDVGSAALAKVNPAHQRSRLASGVSEFASGFRAPKGLGHKGVVDSLADNPITRGNYAVGAHVERRILRGTLAFDRALKGATADQIIDDVFKFHFDYDDLSNFESSVMKRIVPFYTWTRKNFPLQVEMLLTQPKKFNRIGQVSHEIEANSAAEGGPIPSWMTTQGAIRLPFQMGDSQAYLTPDLPYADLQLATDPKQLLGSLNPLIKTPLEVQAGHQFWNDVPIKEGYQPLPDSWEGLGLGKALEVAGRAKRKPDGTLVAKGNDIYALEQFIPILGRARRLVPGDDQKYQDRLAGSLVNFFFGAGLKANTKSDQGGEMYRRETELDRLAQELQTSGRGGYYQYQKYVAEKSDGAKSRKRGGFGR